ncbi:putative protein ABIL5 [Cocos nucifera]|nr:putative protein ABIL5 [Cocos nucifera]
METQIQNNQFYMSYLDLLMQCNNNISNIIFSRNLERVVESTKSYICDAVVAMVDHLGNVSSKLEHRLHGNIEVVQTEQKIDCLKQRLLMRQQYAVSLDLSAVRWSAKLPRYHQHYLSPSAQHPEKSTGISRDEAADKISSETPSGKDQLAVAICPSVSVAGDSLKIPNVGAGITFSTAVPVLEGPSILSKPCNSSFGSHTDVRSNFSLDNFTILIQRNFFFRSYDE